VSGKIVRRVDWTLAWNIEKHEQWLEGLAATGLHLLSANPFGAHRFIEGEAKTVRYRLDFSWGSLPGDYEQLIREAGWERVDSTCGWHYWRTEDAAAPEIFTDGPSKAAKFRSLRLFTLVFALYEVIQLALSLPQSDGPGAADYLRIAVLVFLVYCAIRFTRQIRLLENEHAGAVIK
jgi:hypothetical protein